MILVVQTECFFCAVRSGFSHIHAIKINNVLVTVNYLETNLNKARY